MTTSLPRIGDPMRVPDTATMRDAFIDAAADLLDDDPRVAVVLADISVGHERFAQAAREHPDRVLNVGIREALMVSTAGGLALSGMRPIAHTYAPFLVERAYEQIKLDFEHQGVGGILVSVGASYDWSQGGYTHFSPGDVALFDTMPDWTVHVPGHPKEVGGPLRAAALTDDKVYMRLSTLANAAPHQTTGKLSLIKSGEGPLVVAVGPTLDNVLLATAGMSVTVAYANTVRPFDLEGLRALAHTGEVVLVEPYLEGTSSRLVAEALIDRPHRTLAIGVKRVDLHKYGTPADHDRWHGLDPATISERIAAFSR